MKIEFYRHNIEEEDIQELNKVLHSIFLTTGPITKEFETKFSQYTGLKETIGLTSCTAALHLSLLALGIGEGDEVITTPMTFIASATSILHAGAKPIFVDVEKDTGLMDVNKIESVITKRTKAILPVHLYGTMVDMVGLRKIADKYNLKVIEDCAHCIEASRDGIRPGDLSDAACYSFYATKNLACGEGGAVATNNLEIAKKIRILRTHGMSKEAADRYTSTYTHWDMTELGWKYNMFDVQAALLTKQIQRIDDYWKQRNHIIEIYNSEFKNCNNITIPSIVGKGANHLYTIWVQKEKRDFILQALQEKSIGVAVNYRAIHNLSFFKNTYNFKSNDFPVADDIGNRTITIPLYPKLKEIEIQYIIDAVKEVTK